MGAQQTPPAEDPIYVRVFSWAHDGVGGHNSGRIQYPEAIYGPYDRDWAKQVYDAIEAELWPDGQPSPELSEYYEYGTQYVDVVTDGQLLPLPMDLAPDFAAEQWHYDEEGDQR